MLHITPSKLIFLESGVVIKILFWNLIITRKNKYVLEEIHLLFLIRSCFALPTLKYSTLPHTR